MNVVTALRGAAPTPEEDSPFYRTIKREQKALSDFLKAAKQPAIDKVVTLLASQHNPVFVTGIGKSGHIAAKIAATFSSLGISALFLNAADAAHGDLGAVPSRSVVIMLSNSGATGEIMRLVPLLRARGCVLVAMVGRAGSPLARGCEHIILAEVAGEADHIGLAPTSSTTLQLAIGDALAVAASQRRGFTREDFLRHHPAGMLGRQMIPVANLMRKGEDLPVVRAKTPLLEALTVMSEMRMGAACVVDGAGYLKGLIVDGDVRRYLQSGHEIRTATAETLMQASPLTIDDRALLGDVMLSRDGWMVLPVVDQKGRLTGMLHAQDIVG